jgi:hypothetical protein
MPPPADMRFEFSRIQALHYELWSCAFNDSIDYTLVDERYDMFCDRALRTVYGFDERRPEGVERLLGSVGFDDDHVQASFKANDDVTETKPDESKVWSDRVKILSDMLFDYYGKEVTPVSRNEIAWRIAGSVGQLKKFKPMEKTFVARLPEWTMLRIEDMRYGIPTHLGKPTLAVTFRVFDGPFGGLTFIQRIPYKYWMAVIKRDLGFPAYKHVHKNEFVLARMAGLLEVQEHPRLNEFYASSGMQAHNRKMRKERSTPCTFGYKWECCACTRGHSRANFERGPDGDLRYSDCPRATHSMTYKQGSCPRCRRDDAWFDAGDKMCVECKADLNRNAIKMASYGR